MIKIKKSKSYPNITIFHALAPVIHRLGQCNCANYTCLAGAGNAKAAQKHAMIVRPSHGAKSSRCIEFLYGRHTPSPDGKHPGAVPFARGVVRINSRC